MSQAVEQNYTLEIIQSNRTILFWDPSFPITNETAVYDPVPIEYNVFSLLNIPDPPGASPKNWTLVFGQGSPWQSRMSQMFEVSLTISYQKIFLAYF